MCCRSFAVAVLVLASTAFAVEPTAAEGDWPWWRGPSRDNHAVGNPPTTWSATENVVWRTPIPGRGHSSPTVVGDRIYLATADEGKEIQSVVAFERATGKRLWETEVSRGGFPNTHRKNTHATCTIACDGERLFVAFHHDGRITFAALDTDGEELWKRDAGPFDPALYEYGYAPSPVLYGETVIIAADVEKGGWMQAFDRKSGKPVWKTNRPKKLSFSSPVVATIAGKDQLLISGCEAVASYDPATGKGNWVVAATTMATCGTMVWDGDIVYASGGYPKAETVAIKADGSGDILWRNGQKCYEQSMLAHDGFVYAVTDQGIAACWDGKTGEERWRQRLSGPISASPVLVGGNVHVTNEAGTTWVFEATPEAYRKVAENRLGNEAFATPAYCGDLIYTRVAFRERGQRQEYLYCLGQ